jgi:hypothetical protein
VTDVTNQNPHVAKIGELSHQYELGIEVSAMADLVVRALRLPPTAHEAEKLFAGAAEPLPIRRPPATDSAT